jgi:hypothetical protein
MNEPKEQARLAHEAFKKDFERFNSLRGENSSNGITLPEAENL